MEVPLVLDLDFDFDFESQGIYNSVDDQADADGLELRSPRSPISTQESPASSNPSSPFDASIFFQFPLDPPSNEASPVSPLSSPAANSSTDVFNGNDSGKVNRGLTLPPPQRPLTWIWTCHLCHSRYPLGATRRCLIDGHWYCSGVGANTNQRNVKRKKKGQACSSEFDYVGWQEWLYWRQRALTQKHRLPPGVGRVRPVAILRGCENCEYPSQCRYERLDQVPDVVPTTSKKAKAKKDDSAPTGSTSVVDNAVYTARGENQNQGTSVVPTNSDAALEEQNRVLLAEHDTGRQIEATAKEPQHSKMGSGTAAEVNLQSTSLPQLKRTKSRSGKTSKDKLGLRQSQISDFFRITRNL